MSIPKLLRHARMRTVQGPDTGKSLKTIKTDIRSHESMLAVRLQLLEDRCAMGIAANAIIDMK
jgi:hypothetical protein